MRLSFRVILTIVTTLVIIMSLGTLVLVRRQTAFFTDKMKKEASILSNSISLTVNQLAVGHLNNRDYMQAMTEKLGGLPGIREIIVYDPQGVVLADTDRKWVGQSKAKEFEDVKGVLDTGKTFQGVETVEGKSLYSNTFPIYLQEGDRKKIVGIGEVNIDLAEVAKTVTLKDQANLLAGVVALNLEKILRDDLSGQDYLQKLTEKIGQTEGVHEVMVYNPEGTVIGDTDKKWLGENKREEFEDLREVLETKRPYEGYEKVEGEDLYSSLVPIFSQGQELIGVVETAMSLGHVQKQLATARNHIIFLTGISIAAISFFIFLLMQKNILHPLQKLSGTTKAIAGGDLSKRAEVISNDEIGELAVSFNGMTDAIQKKNEELQSFNEELQAANEELKTTMEELESTNEELKAANEEIREAQEKLVQQEKLAAVGQLASGVGHELRNPLGVLKNAVYFIKTKVGTQDEKIGKHIRIMEKEIDNSTKIISDLLGFSRTRKPVASPSDLHRVLEDALSVVEMPLNVRLSKEFDARLPQVTVDPDQMRQVFLNLILNAVQAMSEGGLLTIGTRSVDTSVEVRVQDTGCGIPQENIKKLFDPFFTTKARGVGLGLAVSHGMVERHGGKIEVQSVLGRGATFTVTLPAG